MKNILTAIFSTLCLGLFAQDMNCTKIKATLEQLSTSTEKIMTKPAQTHWETTQKQMLISEEYVKVFQKLNGEWCEQVIPAVYMTYFERQEIIDVPAEYKMVTITRKIKNGSVRVINVDCGH